MDSQLSGERLTEERAFVKRFSEGLSSHKVEYPADFSTPLEERPRKVPVVQVPVAEPPDLMDVDAPAQDTSVSLTVKSLKPSISITVTAQLTDSVADLKALVAQSSPSAPPVEAQRLLIKGKALTDAKLLKEYDLTDGATVHLILKPVDKAASTPVIASPAGGSAATSAPPAPAPSQIPRSDMSTFAGSSAHPEPPSLTITTSLDDSTPGTAMPLTVTDAVAPPLGPQPQVSSASFHETVANPVFWQKLHALCVTEFTYENDADAAWETFLISMKGLLSAGEAAKIRDVVGVMGMGGA
ncbi:hypothetical protein JCM24511_00585 [Saitozyma sp. JCM 24511]|nr:hypothetical protein JCM24511_00585 [Saitozyma sp. JCM 24511]